MCYTIRFLIHFFSLTNNFISFLLVSLVVLALFIFSLQDKTSFSPNPQNASSWDTPDFKRVIVVIPLRLIENFSLLMSPSLRTHPSPPPLSLFLFLKSYPFLLSPRLYLMLCLLDHFRFIIVVTVPLFLSLLLRSLLTHFLSHSASPISTLPLAYNLLIALQKGNRSISNPHPIYKFLSYHRLSSSYSAFVSAISYVSLPKNTNEALSHPGWR